MEPRKRSASASSKQQQLSGTASSATSLGVPLGGSNHVSSPHQLRRVNKNKRMTAMSKVLLGAIFCLPILLFLIVVWFVLIPLWNLKTPTSPKSIKYDVDRILHHPFGVVEITKAIEDWAHLDVSTLGLHTVQQEEPPYVQKFLPTRPRIVGHYYEYLDNEESTYSYLGTQALDVNTIYMPRAHSGLKLMTATQESQGLQKSDDYWYGLADAFEEGDCKARYDYQLDTKPTCNLVLEQDLTDLNTYMEWITSKETPGTNEPFLVNHAHIAVKLLSNGYWRDVWQVYDQGLMASKSGTTLPGSFRPHKTVLKTMRYEHDYEGRNYDRHRRDAMAMERLTSSPNIMDIYAFCGNSGLFEFADGGSIEDAIWDQGGMSEDWTPRDRLEVAAQLARGLNDLHTVDDPKLPSIAHADVTTSQYVYVTDDDGNGLFKLNDFNRCRFIRKNVKDNSNCGYEVGNNPGKFRAPEEYEYASQSEKVDVYSLGNIFFAMLTSEWPFDEISDKDAQKKVKAGERPVIKAKYIADDPYTQALITGAKWCWTHDQTERPSATQILRYFEKVLKENEN